MQSPGLNFKAVDLGDRISCPMALPVLRFNLENSYAPGHDFYAIEASNMTTYNIRACSFLFRVYLYGGASARGAANDTVVVYTLILGGYDKHLPLGEGEFARTSVTQAKPYTGWGPAMGTGLSVVCTHGIFLVV